jgi:hypothetical protein
MKRVILLLMMLLLSACGGPKTMYVWDDYEPGIYSILKKEDTDLSKQICNLEKTLQRSQAKGQRLPPGFYAHLGMLYGKSGDTAKMNSYFRMEKQQFPESSAYIDFLMKEKKA